MKVLAHVSDPHFGTEDRAVHDALLADLDGHTGSTPALILVSGDLTQRARTEQFRAARQFLDQLTAPYLVVPGNHDVPLYDLVSRFHHPLRKYKQHITDDLMPTFLDDDVAVVGLTTPHGWTVKSGKITAEQVRAAAAWFEGAGDRIRIVVAHHPFSLPDGRSPSDLVEGAAMARPILEAAGVTLICTGHLHLAFSTDTVGFRSEDREIVNIHAGTCMSTRVRGEPQGYNRLKLDGDSLTLQTRIWNQQRFVDGPMKLYRRSHGRWRKDAEQAA